MRTKKQIDIEVLEWCLASLEGIRPAAVPEECWESVRATGRLLLRVEPDWRERLDEILIGARDFVLPFRQWAVLEAYNLAHPSTVHDCPSPTLTLSTSEWDEDWYSITDWEGEMVSDASVEGTGAEMLALAEAIENRRYEGFRRCAVTIAQDGVFFHSPRNSEGRPEWFSLAEADTLAARIRKVVGGQ